MFDHLTRFLFSSFINNWDMVLKFPSKFPDLFISSFVNIFFTYFKMFLLGICTFIIFMYSEYIDPFIVIKFSSLLIYFNVHFFLTLIKLFQLSYDLLLITYFPFLQLLSHLWQLFSVRASCRKHIIESCSFGFLIISIFNRIFILLTVKLVI